MAEALLLLENLASIVRSLLLSSPAFAHQLSLIPTALEIDRAGVEQGLALEGPFEDSVGAANWNTATEPLVRTPRLHGARQSVTFSMDLADGAL